MHFCTMSVKNQHHLVADSNHDSALLFCLDIAPLWLLFLLTFFAGDPKKDTARTLNSHTESSLYYRVPTPHTNFCIAFLYEWRFHLCIQMSNNGILLYYKITLHVSGTLRAHHQEYINCS
jgi:hypothetical protein